MPFNYNELFGVIGRLAARLAEADAFRGATVPAGIDLIDAAFCAAADPSPADGLYAARAAAQGSLSGWTNYLRTLAQATVIRSVGNFQEQSDSSLSTALAFLIKSMLADGQTVRACTVGASIAAAAGNIGNPRVVVSTKYRSGLAEEYLFAEAINLTVTTDAQSGAVAAGNELASVRGRAAAPDVLSWAWPAGSGCSTSLSAVDPLTQSGRVGGGNLLRNSSWETWTTANIPDGWVVRIGTPGVEVRESLLSYYDGSACLAFAGGVNNTYIDQTFGSAAGTTATLAPQSVYHGCLWVRTDAAPAAGVLDLALVDGAGVVIGDARGTPNSVDMDLATVGTSFAPMLAAFRTPAVLPATIRLRLTLSTPLTAGVTVFLDKLSFAPATQAYPGGLFLTYHAGNIPVIVGDNFTVTTTNDRAGKFQTFAERVFSMRSLGLVLPSSATPTISDALIA